MDESAYDLVGRALVGANRYMGGLLLSTGLRWGRQEEIALAWLTRHIGGVSLGAASRALGRSESSILDRCKRLKLPVPASWT